jgi:hypothetical protein
MLSEVSIYFSINLTPCVEKFYFRDLFRSEDKDKKGWVEYRRFTAICREENLMILPGMVSQLRQRYENKDLMINYMKVEKDMIAADPRYKQYVGANEEETR